MNDLSQARAGIEETLGVGRKKRSPWRKRAIWGGAILAAVAVLYFIFASGGDTASYKTEAVKRGPLSVKVTATGTLQPIDQVEVGAEVSGRAPAASSSPS